MGPFGHNGPFGHHGPFGPQRQDDFGHCGPRFDRGWSPPCHQRPGDWNRPRQDDRPHFAWWIFRLLMEGPGFGPWRGFFGRNGPEAICGRDARDVHVHCCCEEDWERPCRRRGLCCSERQHGSRFDHHCRRRTHCRIGDEELHCCRHRGRSGPCFGPPGYSRHGSHGLWRRSGPHDNECCRRCCPKDRDQYSEDDSGNESEGRNEKKRNSTMNKNDNGKTVFIQRIVVEKPQQRCNSV